MFPFPFSFLGAGEAPLPPELELIDNNFAMEFNGLDEYISANTLSINNAITVSAWIKTSTTGIQTIVNEDQANSNRSWNLLLEPGNKIQIVIKNTNGTVNNKLRSTALEVQDGNWHNIIFTYDGTSNAAGLKTYVDGGNLESFQLSSTGISNTNTLGLFIGSLQGNNGWRFNGDIDEVAVWSRALEATDVQTIYNATNDNPGKCANLWSGGLGTGLVYWNRMGD